MKSSFVKFLTIFIILSLIVAATIPLSVSAASLTYNQLTFTSGWFTTYYPAGGTLTDYSSAQGTILKYYFNEDTQGYELNFVNTNSDSNYFGSSGSSIRQIYFTITFPQSSQSNSISFDITLKSLMVVGSLYGGSSDSNSISGASLNRNTYGSIPNLHGSYISSEDKYSTPSQTDTLTLHYGLDKIQGDSVTVSFSFSNTIGFNYLVLGIDNIEYTYGSVAEDIANIGSDVSQPDFSAADTQLNDTTDKMNQLEGEYKIDQAETTSALSQGTNFIAGTDMQNASIQVKNWIERVFNENTVYAGFILAALGLGLCFWIIGRKGWEK